MSNTSLLGSYGGQDNSSLMFRNKVINGAMTIDQRNAGVQNNTAQTQYHVDRWNYLGTQATKFSIQRSAIAPEGFTSSLLLTSLAATTSGASDWWAIRQVIEGFNIADLGWGTSSAKAITISFWARSSLTGTFGGSLLNDAANRTYAFTYSISAANAWEYKTVAIPGDAAGTWLTDSNAGIRLVFGLGGGASSKTAAGSWTAGAFWGGATGTVDLVGTNGATLYITGVQLESGSATPFERRPMSQELQMCQRYLPVINYNTNGGDRFAGCSVNTTNSNCTISFMVQPRTAPTGITVSAANHWSWSNRRIGAGGAGTAITFQSAGLSTAEIQITTTAGSPTLAAGDFGVLYPSNASAFILFTGCEL